MPLVWLASAVAILAVFAPSIYLTLKALESFRTFKALSRAVTGELERIEQASGQIERQLALASESGSRLEAELSQLRRSRARLNVLTSAIDDVRASIGRVTSVYPRK